MDIQTVPPRSAVTELAGLLDSPEVTGLIVELEATRWTGRPGYPIRAMVGMALAKSLYGLPTWTRTVRLVREHDALRAVIGCDAPSEWACYRFTRKLRANSEALAGCLDRVLAGLLERNPEMGQNVAIDGSSLPAYANGQRFVSKNGPERQTYSDPDASWGHRSAVSTRKGGGYYGYKVHAAVCTDTDLPVAWTTETASAAETTFAMGLLDYALDRGFNVKNHGQGLRQRPDSRRLHGSRYLPDHAAPRDGPRQGGGRQRADVRARRVGVRRGRLQAAGNQGALPDRRVQAEVHVDQG